MKLGCVRDDKIVALMYRSAGKMLICRLKLILEIEFYRMLYSYSKHMTPDRTQIMAIKTPICCRRPGCRTMPSYAVLDLYQILFSLLFRKLILFHSFQKTFFSILFHSFRYRLPCWTLLLVTQSACFLAVQGLGCLDFVFYQLSLRGYYCFPRSFLWPRSGNASPRCRLHLQKADRNESRMSREKHSFVLPVQTQTPTL